MQILRLTTPNLHPTDEDLSAGAPELKNALGHRSIRVTGCLKRKIPLIARWCCAMNGAQSYAGTVCYGLAARTSRTRLAVSMNSAESGRAASFPEWKSKTFADPALASVACAVH